MLDDMSLMITGGTGSFGNAVLRRFLDSGVGEIRIFSRDEMKQDEMRKRYASPKLRFIVGDVRDYGSMADAMAGVDLVFHAAALKQVPSCEFFPMEAVRTNVIGTENMLSAAVANGVKRVICLSTDKAVHPVNAMGISKAMMEKVFVAKARALESRGIVICGTRYGNVMTSRGSVIPLFVKQILAGEPVTITDPTMTRFMMTLEEAVSLVQFGFEHGRNGDIMVQKAPAATLDVLARALIDVLGKPDHPIKIIGTRHGEKKHEMLLSREEMAMASETERYYRISPDLRDLNYSSFLEDGEVEISKAEDYTSATTHQLSVEEMKVLLLSLDLIQAARNGRPAPLAD